MGISYREMSSEGRSRDVCLCVPASTFYGGAPLVANRGETPSRSTMGLSQCLPPNVNISKIDVATFVQVGQICK